MALIAGATAGGAVLYEKRSFSQINLDNKITNQATAAIGKDPTLDERANISVSCYNSILLLVGQTPTPEMRTKAYQLVASIPGVERTYNEIMISGPSSTMQRSSDTWITTKVRSALLAKPGINSTNIKVVTEDGTVYLLGDVSHSQAQLAANVTRRISGVQKVVKVFQYPH